MRRLPLTPVLLAALIALMQYPLWLGKGSWLRVWDLDRQLQAQKGVNRKLQVRNSAIEADVRDLKQGLEAIEERARYELGMVKSDEMFFHVVDGSGEIRAHPDNPAPAASKGQ
jgi:cell division protein FtsB